MTSNLLVYVYMTDLYDFILIRNDYDVLCISIIIMLEIMY